VNVETASATFAGRLLDADLAQGLTLAGDDSQPQQRIALAEIVSLSCPERGRFPV